MTRPTEKRMAPTPESLRDLAEWFDDPRNPAVSVLPHENMDPKYGHTASYLLRRIAEAMEDDKRET